MLTYIFIYCNNYDGFKSFIYDNILLIILFILLHSFCFVNLGNDCMFNSDHF